MADFAPIEGETPIDISELTAKAKAPACARGLS
jgi:hypothetical protein